MKHSVIEEMLYGELSGQWERAACLEEADEVWEEYYKYGDAVDKILSKEHAQLWNDYYDAESGVEGVEKKRAFKMGARFGLLLAFELSEYSPEAERKRHEREWHKRKRMEEQEKRRAQTRTEEHVTEQAEARTQEHVTEQAQTRTEKRE